MNTFREEFAKKLSETVINSATPIEEVNRQVTDLVDFITAHLPQSIFRYRVCNIRNIEALAKNITYGVPMSFMNDPMDGLVYVDKESIFKHVRVGLSEEFYNMIKSTKSLPDSLHLYMGKKVSEVMLQDIMKLSQEEVENKVKQNKLVEADLITGLDKFIDDQISDLQDSSLVVSFTETQYDNSMWAYYAENHTGFVIEYAPQSMRFDYCSHCKNQNSAECKKNRVQAYLYPVIYQNERIDATPWMDSNIGQHILRYMGLAEKDYNPDELFSHRICLVKDKLWAHEKEWRVICKTEEPCEKGKPKSLPTPIPSAIYYGAHIAPEGLSMLRGVIRALSVENNCRIKEYQMKLDTSSKEFKLTAEPL